MRNITIRDFTAGQTACLVSGPSYCRDTTKMKVEEVAIAKVGRKYVTIQNVYEWKFEVLWNPYLSFTSDSDGRDHKLFRNRRDAEEYIERCSILTDIQKRSQMAGDLPTETLRLVSALLQKKEGQELSGIWTLSTAHIRPDTVEYLENQAEEDTEADLCVYSKSEFGWLIAIDQPLMVDESGNNHIPEELANILKRAALLGCEWVCLDRDGTMMKELPVYNY